MNRLSTLQTSLGLSTPLMIPIAQAATMNKADYRSTKARISADYKVAVEKCDALAGDAKTSCVAAAKTKFGKN